MRARILSASAGSGKTYRLAYKYILDTLRYYDEKPYLYRAILAVTFTNKATEEMKRRILNRYAELATDPASSEYINDLRRDLPLPDKEYAARAKSILKRILHDYSHFTVLTIDKFFQRIMRAFVKELGVDVNYNLQIKADDIVSQSADSLIESMKQNEELQRWMLAFARENLDDSKRWDNLRSSLIQLGSEAISEKSHEALQSKTSKQELEQVVARVKAKSDKANNRIVSLGEQALQIIDQAGISLDEFSGKASRGFISTFTKAKNGNLVGITQTAWNKAFNDDVWVGKGNKSGAQELVPQLQPLLAEICTIFEQSQQIWAMYRILKSEFRSFALLKDIYEKIKEVCLTENMMLLSETKNLLAELIKDNDTPFIYEKTGNRYERYMIDEFQDTSLREWNNFIPLLLNAIAMAEDEAVLIVGDVKQAIYRWRGGDWRILHSGVEEALGGNTTIKQPLEDNWRSREAVVEFNNTLISRLIVRLNSSLNAELLTALEDKSIRKDTYNTLYDTIYNAYSSCKQTARKIDPEKRGYVRVESYEEEPDIISYIEDAVARGYSYNDIMILHRNGRDIIKSANTLLDYKRRSGADFNIKTKESLVVGNADIANFVIALLRLSQNNGDKLSLAFVNQYLARDYHTSLSEEELATLNYISQLSAEQAFEHIVKHYSLDKRTEEIAYLQAIHDQIATFSTTKSADIALFLEEWEANFKQKALVVEENDTTIELMTIHTAKGLERKIIIIPYCDWKFASEQHRTTIWSKLNPASTPKEYSALDYFPVPFSSLTANTIFSDMYYHERIYSYVDSLNLLYVALTRAVDELYICIKERNLTGENVGAEIWSLLKDEQDATCYEFGSRTPKIVKPDEKAATTNIILESYPTTDEVVAMRLPLQRYFERREAEPLTQRGIGIMMHSILSKAQSLSDIEDAIDEALKAGRIDTAQRDELRMTIEKELSREEAKEWFGDTWDGVYNECDIIHSDDKIIGHSRPDRVMVKGKRAVIVDYKFGAEKSDDYRLKMELYKRLITRMGYEQVEGYLWYLSRSEIEKV